MAAALFADLKWRGIDCELAAEYAKDLVWEKRSKTFENQIYIFGKQHHRINRLIGQVQVVITDSPIYLTPIYDVEKRDNLKKLVLEEASKWRNLNFFLTRKKPYNPNGRNHSKSEAKIIDNVVENFLIEHQIPYWRVDGTTEGVQYISEIVYRKLISI